jgi:hypothetical protein
MASQMAGSNSLHGADCQSLAASMQVCGDKVHEIAPPHDACHLDVVSSTTEDDQVFLPDRQSLPGALPRQWVNGQIDGALSQPSKRSANPGEVIPVDLI